MKKVLFALGLALAPFAHAIGFDGCYQLYVPGAMYPAFCLDGTGEEGIGGAGVRLVIFRTNTDRIAHCSRSSSSGLTATTFKYFLNGKEELSLVSTTASDDRKEGEATLGHTKLKFSQIDQATSRRLIDAARADRSCSEVGW